MKNLLYKISIAVGFVLLLCGIFSSAFSSRRGLTGTAGKAVEFNAGSAAEFHYDAKVKNTNPLPIRLCGGQLNWCGKGGCYKVITSFPITLEPNQEATITVAISPREDELPETELTLYADGKGLDGLTFIKIKLPALSRKMP